MPVTEKGQVDLKDKGHNINEVPDKSVDYVTNNCKHIVSTEELKNQRAYKLHLLNTYSNENTKSIHEKIYLRGFDNLSYNHARSLVPKTWNSYLKAHSKFTGIQQSSQRKYKIEVELKHVDLYDSLLIGFLTINGLADGYPEITTCFKGEIINNPLSSVSPNTVTQKYTFQTEKKSWGSSLANDLDHWKRLTNYFSLSDDELVKKLDAISKGESDKDKGLIYMRWKEEFLLPDARVKQISGASFEGFYYIVMNVGNHRNPDFPVGSINGLYYYHTSEKFQSLNLASENSMGKDEVFSFV